MVRNLTAIKGLEMPTGNKRCKLVREIEEVTCSETLDLRYVLTCPVTLTHCEGLESDKADDCPMFELEQVSEHDATYDGKQIYVEVKL